MQSKTFCAAPWFQIRNQNLGELQPCCAIDRDASGFAGCKTFDSSNHIDDFMNSDWIKHLRTSLLNGDRPSECHRCWEKEDHGIPSEREILNDKLMVDKGWVSAYFKNRSTESWQIISADWKHNNICNLGCVMCSPIDSSVLYSQWKQKQDHSIVQERMSFFEKDWQPIVDIFSGNAQQDLLDQLLEQSDLRWLKILGGEPLIQKSLLNKLKDIPINKKKQIHLHFVTNGTQDMMAIKKQYLENFRGISFSVSLDATDKMHEWIRPGASWSTIAQNVLSAKKFLPIYVHCVLQSTNLAHLHNLWNWCVENDLALDVDILREPMALSLQLLDPITRETQLDEVEKKLLSTKIASHQNSYLEFGSLKSRVMDLPYVPGMIDKLRKQIEFHNSINDMDDQGMFNWIEDGG